MTRKEFEGLLDFHDYTDSYETDEAMPENMSLWRKHMKVILNIKVMLSMNDGYGKLNLLVCKRASNGNPMKTQK